MLEDGYKSYRKLADNIEWQKKNINELFKETLLHENDDAYDIYFSALVCRFWGYAGRIYVQCNHHVTFEECHDCIIDALRYVLEKRVWEDKNSSLYNDPTAPDKAMHIAMKRQKGIMLSKYSAYRRQSNFNTLSIDGAHSDYNDSADGMLFDFSSDESNMSIKNLISSYFNSDDYLDGIILDIICFSNYNEYSEKNILKSLKELTKDLYFYYRDKYDANENTFNKTLYVIKRTTNRLLEIKIRSLLYTLKKEKIQFD